MSLLLHISDTHFGTEQPPVVAALEALAQARRPDLLVLSGDITQRAAAEQFEAGRQLVERLGMTGRLLALPGNHDIPLFDLFERATRPYRRYLAEFGPRLEPTLAADDLYIVGVNTTRAARHKNGEVSPEQVAHVAAALKRAHARQLRIVVTHQPVDVYRREDQPDRLRGAEEAIQVWSRAGADLVLGGHIHLPYVMDLRRRALATPRPMWCVQAGTAVSSRVRHGTSNSVNLIHWQPPRAGEPRVCEVERCDYRAEPGRFETAERQQLALGA
jgi:3',5'-cyclic AMP phosphodiesterase CpdA